MNSILFFDWGRGGVRGNPSDKNVKQVGGFSFGYSYILTGNIEEQVTVGGTGSGFAPTVAIIKYTNPPKQGNIITVSKSNNSSFFSSSVPQYDCSLVISDFGSLYVVFSTENDIDTDRGYKGFTYKVEDYNNFSITFDTEGKDYKVFMIFDNLVSDLMNYGMYENPPTCAVPYSYITFHRFS